MAAFAEYIAPYGTTTRFRRYQKAPPSTIHWSDENGFRGPFVYAVEQERDPVTRRVTFVENRETVLPIRFFVETEPYKLWGIFELRHKLFVLGPAGEKTSVGIWLFGLDSLARDFFSRTVFGARILLTIGVVSVVLTIVLGTLLGGISGYFGGPVDNIIQRIIELLHAIPQLPLWMTLAAAVPKEWPLSMSNSPSRLSTARWSGYSRSRAPCPTPSRYMPASHLIHAATCGSAASVTQSHRRCSRSSPGTRSAAYYTLKLSELDGANRDSGWQSAPGELPPGEELVLQGVFD